MRNIFTLEKRPTTTAKSGKFPVFWVAKYTTNPVEIGNSDITVMGDAIEYSLDITSDGGTYSVNDTVVSSFDESKIFNGDYQHAILLDNSNDQNDVMTGILIFEK